jgi:hypothetical protein
MKHLVVFVPVMAILVWGLWFFLKMRRVRRNIDRLTRLSKDIESNPSKENLNRAADTFGWPRLP